jgi:TnpA family transposase
LLTNDERKRLFEPPVTAHEIASRYTLSPEDLDWIDQRRGPHNQLGFAVQLALLRHPGFGWRAGEPVPRVIAGFLAEQIRVPVSALEDYAKRPPTHREHVLQLHERLGIRTFRRSDL